MRYSKFWGRGGGGPFSGGSLHFMGGLPLETMVSFILRNFECFKWENHIFVEFLPSSSSVILWVKHKLMQFPIFLVLFLRTFPERGFTFHWLGFVFQLGGWASFFSGSAPWGNISFDVESFQKTHKMEGAVPPYSYPNPTKKPIKSEFPSPQSF